MRKIKFKGFFEGKMFEVEEINFYFGTVEFKGSLGIYDIDKLHNPLMQYTGLKDKKGKEIYEGDIIQNLNSFGCHTSWGDKSDNFPNRRIVCFMDKGTPKFHLDFVEEEIRGRGTSGLCFCKGNEEDFEIIGNIYEQPELLTP